MNARANVMRVAISPGVVVTISPEAQAELREVARQHCPPWERPRMVEIILPALERAYAMGARDRGTTGETLPRTAEEGGARG